MGMTGIGTISMAALICLVLAAVVRFWAAFANTEMMSEDEEEPQADAGIAQTTGNREIQADRAQIQKSAAGVMAVISDGIGKKNTGQVCAQIAVDTILDKFELYSVLNQPDYFFRTTFYEANRRIQATLGERKGGASLGAVFANSTHLYYALAGNIRIAIFRRGELIPLSKGQTLDVLAVEAWKDGKISRQEAVWSMEEKRLWNYLGLDGFHEIEIESQPILTKPGDVVFLATCGIFEELSWSELEDLLAEPGSLEEKAEAIIQKTEQKENAEKENGSVILLHLSTDSEKSWRYGGMA
jgi:Serine/threonine protein phosphatase